MNTVRRTVVVLAATASLVGAFPGAAVAQRPEAAVAHPTLAATTAPSTITVSPAPCSDGKYNLQGQRWNSTLRWSFKASTTPSYLSASAVATVLRRGFGNITNARNDCGRTDRVSATQRYLGATSHAIGVTRTGHCGTSDGANTVGFGALPAGVLALTCVRSIGSRIVETDIRLANQVTWALSLAGCSNDFLLEAVLTHEAGHAYGLGHVGEANHGRLTMSTYIDGTCENQESSLGLGDIRGLEAMY